MGTEAVGQFNIAIWRSKLAATSSKRVRANRPRSERANELLRRAFVQEQNEALEEECAEFCAPTGKTERSESRGFALPGRRSLTRQG